MNNARLFGSESIFENCREAVVEVESDWLDHDLHDLDDNRLFQYSRALIIIQLTDCHHYIDQNSLSTTPMLPSKLANGQCPRLLLRIELSGPK